MLLRQGVFYILNNTLFGWGDFFWLFDFFIFFNVVFLKGILAVSMSHQPKQFFSTNAFESVPVLAYFLRN